MSQKLSVRGSETVKNTSQFTGDFIKNYNEDSNTRYCLKLGVQYPKKYMKITMIYHFTRKDKNKKLCSLNCKKEYVVDIKNLKKALNHG